MTNTYIHPSAIVESGAECKQGVKIWHFCHVREEAVLEEKVSLGKGVYVDKGVRIGSGSRIQNGVSVYYGVHIGSWCFVGPEVIFTNDTIPRAGNVSWEVVETHILDGASIGAGAVIRCGITLGEFSMIGAGAIVTKSVPAFQMALGFPASIVSKICACGRSTAVVEDERFEVLQSCCNKNLRAEVRDRAAEVARLIQT